MLEAGRQFAHFRIERKLGEGGMGVVFLAEDLKLHRKVALKTLTSDVFGDAERLERFHREAKTAAQVNNAYVTAIYDVDRALDETSGREIDYIVMEYVQGRSLADYIKEDRPDLPRLTRLAEKIAAGLAAAHKLNIVHRDIKPENILIDENEDPKILDFGLAKPLDPIQYEKSGDNTASVSQNLTQVGKIMGTVSYMSPEQVRGERVDPRSDIFAFGILLYRMVTGDLPFSGPTQVETMAKILESSFEPPSSRNEAVPMELERAIVKCLQKDPDDRYQTSRDLVVDLRNVRRMYDSGISESLSGISGAQTRVKKSAGRRIGLAVGAVVILTAAIYYIVGGPAGGPVRGGLQARENALAILGFENKTGDAALDWLETGLPEILLTDLSQNQGLRLISQQRILDCLPEKQRLSPTHEQCVKTAADLGATRLLSGAFYKVGDHLRIDARLEDVASGQIIIGEKVVGVDPMVLVDSLTDKITMSLGMSQTANVSQYTSASPEAYKQYHAGMELFWVGEMELAIDRFKEAVSIDSSFALPYMRIAMANTFQGRQGEAAPYFQRAQQFGSGLPPRDRALLDAYLDTWLRSNFDDAFAKLKALLATYPDDAEIRTIYALFIETFQRDTVLSFAQFDTVLAQYPNNLFALDNFAAVLIQHGNYDRGLAMAEKYANLAPGYLAPRRQLAAFYRAANRLAESEAMYLKLHAEYPRDRQVIERLRSIATTNRRFDQVRRYSDAAVALAPDDPYVLSNHYNTLANLAVWEGKFLQSIALRHRVLEQTRRTGSDQMIAATLNNLAGFFRQSHLKDSAIAYARAAYEIPDVFQRFTYPMMLVHYDRTKAGEARPMFKQAINDFKARIPSDFWGLVVDLERVFEAVAVSDTAALIEAYRSLMVANVDNDNGNRRELAELLVRTGQYAEGRDLLDRDLAGDELTNTAGTT
jgi:tetratricopeptide (TPR) repeat protein/predicted Ser/Thr protein kinase